MKNLFAVLAILITASFADASNAVGCNGLRTTLSTCGPEITLTLDSTQLNGWVVPMTFSMDAQVCWGMPLSYTGVLAPLNDGTFELRLLTATFRSPATPVADADISAGVVRFKPGGGGTLTLKGEYAKQMPSSTYELSCGPQL